MNGCQKIAEIPVIFLLFALALGVSFIGCVGGASSNRGARVEPDERQAPEIEKRETSPTRDAPLKEPSPPPRVSAPPVQMKTPPPSRSSLLKSLKNFTLEILTDDEAVCPGPDGKSMVYFGRKSKFRLVLRCHEPPLIRVLPGDLFARIGDGPQWKYAFSREISPSEYTTEIISMESLEGGLDTGPIGIFIYYEKNGETLFLGRPQTIVIDARPPAAPKNLHVTERGDGFYTLAWDPPPGAIHEYRVEQWREGAWSVVLNGFRAPFARIRQEPRGRVRVTALDCAGNAATSDEASIDPPSMLTVTVEGKGKTRYGAYVAATVLINAEFVKMYVSPWLEEHTSLDRNEVNVVITQRLSGWAPPGIRYTSRNKAAYHFKDGLWSAEIQGSLHKKTFENWIRQRASALPRY